MESISMQRIAVVLLLAWSVNGAFMSGSSSSKPFRSKKSPSETIHQYEVIEPEVSYGQDQSTFTEGNHPKDIGVLVHALKGTYHLRLELNELLLAPSFASGYHINGEKVEEHHENCFYHGTVEGHDDWRAVFSTCYGLRGWFGDLNDPSNLYHIEPMEDTTSLTGPHALYLDSEHQNSNERQRTCGTTRRQHGVDDILGTGMNVQESGEHHSIKKRESLVAPQTRIVEWLLVNDHYQYINFDSNITAVTHRAIELANHVDLLYDQLNISVVLVYSLTWTEGQNISFTNDSDLLLSRFRTYHMTNEDLKDIIHDSAMLITGIEIEGLIVGLAYVNHMCEYNDGVGFIQDTGSSVAVDGTTAAHELGHIFNMQHDDDPSCMCPDSVEGCIMNAFIKDPTLFSQCSLDELAEAISQGKDSCLGNHPTTLVGDPVCGNGIREPGEVCDCGSAELCNDPCCDPTSCTLSAGSDCGEGECCDNCQFKPYGTTCRASSTDCGITEYCTGDSSDCPSDVYQQDGTPCSNDTSYCFDGLCPSADDQCSLYWGTGAISSIPNCYTIQNVMGTKVGHCGVMNSAFVACLSEHVKCGSLQCEEGMNIPLSSNINAGSSVMYGAGFAYYQGTYRYCKWITTAATADEVSPGLVFDGTKCDENKLCLSQQCVSISSLGLAACPVGSNGEVCSGNGVCNNLDQCSCNIGYTGTNCSSNYTSDTVTTTTETYSPSTSSSAGSSSVVITTPIQSTVTIHTEQSTSSTTRLVQTITTSTTESFNGERSTEGTSYLLTTTPTRIRSSSAVAVSTRPTEGTDTSGRTDTVLAIGASVAAVVLVVILAVLIVVTAGIIILLVKCNRTAGASYGDGGEYSKVDTTMTTNVVLTKTVTTPPESDPIIERFSENSPTNENDYELEPIHNEKS